MPDPDIGPDERRVLHFPVAVEGQPLAANIERLDQALQKQIDRGDGEEVLLPLTMFYGPGPEYRWLKRQ